MAYIKQNYQADSIRLGVADFNLRAQKVYERAGFVKTKAYQQATNGSVYTLIEMERNS